MRTTPLLAALFIVAGSTTALAQQQEKPERPSLPAQAAQPAQDIAALQRSPDAVAALQVVAEAIAEGYAAEIKSYADGSPFLAAAFPKSEGHWSQRALAEDAPWAVRYTGLGMVMSRTEPVEFDVLWQPDRTTWIDHDNKIFHVDRPEGKKRGEAYQLASSAWGQLKDLAQGFAESIENAAGLAMHEPAEVDGVLCDVVAITTKPTGDPVVWYFGHDDHLPRRSEIILPGNEEISGSLRVDFLDGAVGADVVTDDEFQLLAPDGYEREIARTFQSPEGRPAGIKPMPLPSKGQAGAPDWEVPDSDGALVSPGSLRGKVSVLYFWGTWSPACKKATPELQKLVDTFAGEQVEVISMAFREDDPATTVKAARQQGQTWRQVPNADDAVKVMGIRTAPSVVVLGMQGELLFRSGRPKSDDYKTLFSQVHDIIERALSEDPAPETDKKSGDGPEAKGPGKKVAPAGIKPAKPGRFKKKD